MQNWMVPIKKIKNKKYLNLSLMMSFLPPDPHHDFVLSQEEDRGFSLLWLDIFDLDVRLGFLQNPIFCSDIMYYIQGKNKTHVVLKESYL